MLLGKWILEWLDLYKKNYLKATTYENYLIYMEKHILSSSIANIDITKLTSKDLQVFYNEKLDSGLSNRTVRYIRTIIGGALNQAEKNGMLSRKPNKATILPPKENHEIIPLNIEEVNKILDEAKGSEFYPLVLLEMFTGLRKGEILGLCWSDIDFERNILTVKRNLCRIQMGIDSKSGKKNYEYRLLEPKTESSKRRIFLPENVMQILKKHQNEQQIIREKNAEIYQDRKLVFARSDGNYISPRQVLRIFHRILDNAGVRRCRFHDLRHTVASILLNEGEEMKVIQELLGHSTITTTMDVYSHLSDQKKRNTSNKLAQVYEIGEK